MTRSLILGVGGQDGSYLADLLLARGDAVAGLHRHSSVDNMVRVAGVRDRLTLFRGDVLDVPSVERALTEFRPDEVYHVADQDRVDWSRAVEDYQRQVTLGAVEALLGRVWALRRDARVFVPLSCTMFAPSDRPLAEAAPTAPDSPYARFKLEAWKACRYWRGAGIRVSCGIMFNHDSVRRGPGYVLQDVVRGAVAVARGEQQHLTVKALDARVDVGSAPDLMRAAVRMLETDPDDFCVGTGEAWTVRHMCLRALLRAHVRSDQLLAVGRAADVLRESDPVAPGAPARVADVVKARRVLGWAPAVGVGDLIDELVDHHLGAARG